MLCVLRADEHVAMPWANGAGVTYQVAAFPNNSDLGTFGWRVSMADVSQSGPFSHFAGIDRILTVIGPHDFELTINGETVGVPRHSPLNFAGEDDVSVELLDGPTTDLNVMTRRGEFVASVAIHNAAAGLLITPALRDTTLGVVLQGEANVTADGSSKFTMLNTRDVVVTDRAITIKGPGLIALITISPK